MEKSPPFKNSMIDLFEISPLRLSATVEMTEQCDYQYYYSEINHPQRRGPCVRDVIEALFCYVGAFVAGDGVEPHRGAVEEC